MRLRFVHLLLIVTFISSPAVSGKDNSLSARESLGKRLFFDPLLSATGAQSCASCHSPAHGFADPRPLAVSEGAIQGRFTSRSAPAIAYNVYSPALHRDPEEEIYIGGYFHDGRASSLEQQIEGPMLGALEMANKSRAEVVERLRNSVYMKELKQLYGDEALKDTDTGFAQVAELIASYERSFEVNSFTSKYDFYLEGKAVLSAQELRGLKIFEDENKGNCAACHASSRGNDGQKPLFTDFSYDNLGVPVNINNPFLKLGSEFNPDGFAFRDRGLGAFVNDRQEDGKFRVPTLRNIALTAPYMHNGVFSTLEEVVDFYNTRDVDQKWDAPEIPGNANKEELGDLKLTRQEVNDLVAFLKTLSDGFDQTVQSGN